MPTTKSAERGCAANCRLLLQAQSDQTNQEVEPRGATWRTSGQG
jgi:hypothetical protein